MNQFKNFISNNETRNPIFKQQIYPINMVGNFTTVIFKDFENKDKMSTCNYQQLDRNEGRRFTMNERRMPIVQQRQS